MIVEVIFQTYQLDIFQGSTINDLWETRRSPIKQNIFDTFCQKRISVFQEFLPSSLPPSLPYAKSSSDISLVIIYI